jgi:V/A-type H+-transporting ATPase subunit A
MSEVIGVITRINGPVVQAEIDGMLAMSELVWIGEEELAGEVIRLAHNSATIQVYEETEGLRPGAPLRASGSALAVTLGPGLLGNIFDGIQRPLLAVHDQGGIFIRRGVRTPSLPQKRWHFTPKIQEGEEVTGGTLIGTVPETELIEHRILTPPDMKGHIAFVASAGNYDLDEPIAQVIDQNNQEHTVTLSQRWPVRRERPITQRLEVDVPLITGQRILDTFFPLAKGGAAAIPGPFGAGKTVIQHSLAKWSDAQIIVYIGCGERGNEMAQVVEDFPTLTDPRTGRPLMERTILIANTSNMPVAAREASIYTGITMAEYYRDQGYDVALMADSTSRWAEALREISGRLEEMPAEEGFPAYLPSRLAAFYERAGRVRTLSDTVGSVTIIGAVSPPGGDFSEPVTQHTQRFTRCFWGLDRTLASARRFPAVNWQSSYSFYVESVADWWQARTAKNGGTPGNLHKGATWTALRHAAANLLEEEAQLQQIVRLVGADALPDRQRWILDAANLLTQGFLQQNALSSTDAYAAPQKQLALLRLFVDIYQNGAEMIKQGVPALELRHVIDTPRLIRLKEEVTNEEVDRIDQVRSDVSAKIRQLGKEYRGIA